MMSKMAELSAIKDQEYLDKLDKPFMICIRCNSKYTLPLKYEECNPVYRDYCPLCMESVLWEHASLKDTRELLEKIEREDARDILKREIEKMKHG
jgi:hypothetical protein